MIELEINGERYTRFASASVSLRIDALSNTFSINASSKNGEPLPFMVGTNENNFCKIFVDGEKVLDGFYETVEVDYDSNTHNISIMGRDRTGDLLDSTLDSISDIGAPISLKGLIQKILSEINLDIRVIDNVNPPKFNKAEDIASPDVGENAFSFLEKYARKRQVLLTSDADGNIVIEDGSGEKINSPLRNIVNGTSNNILEGSVSYDSTGRYNFYKFASSLNTNSLNFAGSVSLDDVVDQKGDALDREIRRSRQLILVAEDPLSNEQNILRSEWEANVRKARGRVYSATVDGFRNLQGDLWSINKLVSVVDEFAAINANMLINTVTFDYDLRSGSTTTLGMVNENAYTLSLNEPRFEKVGNGIFG